MRPDIVQANDTRSVPSAALDDLLTQIRTLPGHPRDGRPAADMTYVQRVKACASMPFPAGLGWTALGWWFTRLVVENSVTVPSTLTTAAVAAVLLLGYPAYARRNVAIVRSRGYWLCAGFSGVALGCILSAGPIWAFVLALGAVVATLYGGQQIGRYKGHKEVQATAEKLVVELQQAERGNGAYGDGSDPQQRLHEPDDETHPA